jgi:glycogen operon protein
MGDEARRTQRGNNNAYCQDNEISWFDWRLVDTHADLIRFVQMLCLYRQHREVVSTSDITSLQALIERAGVTWHGVTLNRPDWGERSHSLAVTRRTVGGRALTHAMFNAYWEPLTFELPEPPAGEGQWRRCIDTALPSPDDFRAPAEAPAIDGRTYTLQPRSVAVVVLELDSSRREPLPV